MRAAVSDGPTTREGSGGWTGLLPGGRSTVRMTSPESCGDDDHLCAEPSSDPDRLRSSRTCGAVGAGPVPAMVCRSGVCICSPPQPCDESEGVPTSTPPADTLILLGTSLAAPRIARSPPQDRLRIGSGHQPVQPGSPALPLASTGDRWPATALAGRGLLPPTPGRVGGAVSLVVALPAGGVLSPNGRTPRGRLQALTRLRRRRPAVSAPCRLGTVQTGAPVPPYAALLTLAAFMIAVDVRVLKRTCPDRDGQRGDRSALSSPRKTIPHCPQPARRARMSSAPRVALAIASSPSTESKSSFLRALSCITFSSMVPAETIRYTRTFLV